MLVMKSQCLPRLLLPVSVRHNHNRPLDARRHRRVSRAVAPTVYVPDASTAVTAVTVATAAAPSDTQPLALFLAGGLGMALLIGLGFSTQLQGRGTVMTIPPSKVAALLENKESLFLDVRDRKDIKDFGSPDFKNTAAKQKTLSFFKTTKDGDIPDPKFGESFAKTKGLKTDSVVVLMDSDGTSGNEAARAILNFSDVKEVLVISGGAVKLKASGWEWREPTVATPLSLPKVSMSLPKVSVKGLDLDKVAETYKERPTLFNTGLAIGALATAGVVLFNEFDIILEMVGILGGTNVLFKRFFYAEDREKTIKDLRILLDDKIAAGEAADDLKRLAATILENPPPSMEREQTTTMPSVKVDNMTDQLVDTI